MKKINSIIMAIALFLVFSATVQASFSDTTEHKYKKSIEFIKSRNVVTGYADGTFRPDDLINRAELLKVVLESNYEKSLLDSTTLENCFKDVTANQWFAKYVCMGKIKGIVKGYQDGLFRPGQNVNFVEALKILQIAYGLPYDDSSSPWYENSVRYASSINIIPNDITHLGLFITRGQMAEMLTRLIKYKENTLQEFLETTNSTPVSYESLEESTKEEEKEPAAAQPAVAQPAAAQPGTGDPKTLPLLQFENLVYKGAFRLPIVANAASKFQYGGSVLAYNPIRDSLFIVGHDWEQMVAEVTIPEIINSNNLQNLATAELIQTFTDPSEGKMKTVDNDTIKVGGLLVYANKLIGSAYSYFDANKSQVSSHFISQLDFSVKDDAEGMFQLGNKLGAGFVSGYMSNIPEEWQNLLGGPVIAGQCCIPIISRTSFGPSAFAFNPSDLGVTNPVDITPLMYYTEDKYYGAWDDTNNYFNGSTMIRGLAFPDNTRSILFIGKQGIGTFCYGTGAECNDPILSSKGIHANPYIDQIWAYDALDLLAVKNGEKEPWEVRPYDIWPFDLPFSKEGKQLGGITYKPETREIFISQSFGDGDNPIIHIFEVE